MPKEGIHPKYETIHVKCACGVERFRRKIAGSDAGKAATAAAAKAAAVK